MVRLVRTPAIAQVAAAAGLDFIMLDMEHGPYSMETLADVASAASGAGVGCFVRVPELAKGYVSRALDAGTNGLMVPMISGVEQAKALVGWSKYEPVGNRGFGSVAGHTGYGPAGEATAFFETANRDTLIIAQIELASAIEEIDGIAALDGIDALLIGPNDLAISLGVAGQMGSPVLEQAIGKVAEAASKHGKIFGMHGPDSLLERWIPEGLTLVMSALDNSMLLLNE